MALLQRYMFFFGDIGLCRRDMGPFERCHALGSLVLAQVFNFTGLFYRGVGLFYGDIGPFYRDRRLYSGDVGHF